MVQVDPVVVREDPADRAGQEDLVGFLVVREVREGREDWVGFPAVREGREDLVVEVAVAGVLQAVEHLTRRKSLK